MQASLRRLDTDRVDLLYLHRFDNRTDLEQTFRSLDRLVGNGDVVYVGVTNFAAWQVAAALGLSAQHDWAPLVAMQPKYNLIKRQAEVEIAGAPLVVDPRASTGNRSLRGPGAP